MLLVFRHLQSIKTEVRPLAEVVDGITLFKAKSELVAPGKV